MILQLISQLLDSTFCIKCNWIYLLLFPSPPRFFFNNLGNFPHCYRSFKTTPRLLDFLPSGWISKEVLPMKIKRNLWRAYLKWHESADHYCQDFLSFNRTFKWQYDIKDRIQHSDWKELGLTLSAWAVFQVEIAHAHTLPLLLLAPERGGGE